jgi:hypothetical protein
MHTNSKALRGYSRIDMFMDLIFCPIWLRAMTDSTKTFAQCHWTETENASSANDSLMEREQWRSPAAKWRQASPALASCNPDMLPHHLHRRLYHLGVCKPTSNIPSNGIPGQDAC